MSDFEVGDRVELHPASALWMRGARFGEVVKVDRTFVHVRLDRTGRVVKFLPSLLTPLWIDSAGRPPLAQGTERYARYAERRKNQATRYEELLKKQELTTALYAELRQAAEWFGDEEHGVPLRSETEYTGRREDWKGYEDDEGRPRFQLSERSYVAICEALAIFDELDPR